MTTFTTCQISSVFALKWYISMRMCHIYCQTYDSLLSNFSAICSTDNTSLSGNLNGLYNWKYFTFKVYEHLFF